MNINIKFKEKTQGWIDQHLIQKSMLEKFPTKRWEQKNKMISKLEISPGNKSEPIWLKL